MKPIHLHRTAYDSIPEEKHVLRSQYQDAVDEYLANGGKVTQCPPLQFADQFDYAEMNRVAKAKQNNRNARAQEQSQRAKRAAFEGEGVV